MKFRPKLSWQFFAAEQVTFGAVLTWHSVSFLCVVGVLRFQWFGKPENK